MAESDTMSRGRIALIDDDETIHLIFKVLMSKCFPDIVVESYIDVREALEQIKDDAFDASLVILDISMPRMTGWEFLENIPNGFDIPIYMHTSSDDPRDRVRACEFKNVRGYLVKPLKMVDLQVLIDAHFC